MQRLGRNDPCHCGSGKKYKRCCLDADVAHERIERLRAEVPPADPELMAEVMPILQARMAEAQEGERRLRDEYGVYINYVRPVMWQDQRVWAIGSRVYLDRRPNETFHEFILSVLRETYGEDWWAEQSALPVGEQHVVLRCFYEFGQFTHRHANPDQLKREGAMSAEANGWVSYLLSLAWDVATLIHAAGLPDALVRRLRNREQFQGARYEIAVAAIFARHDCEIRFLDEDKTRRRVKHVEFDATHRPTEQTIAVEAKSRHRAGVLNERGEPTEDPLQGDMRAVRRLFTQASDKAPGEKPYFVFLDVNAPATPEIEQRWQEQVQAWMNRMPDPQPEDPAVYNALYVTNFSPHYDGNDISRAGTWQATLPAHVHQPLSADLWPALVTALNTYGRVPAISERSPWVTPWKRQTASGRHRPLTTLRAVPQVLALASGSAA